MSFFNGNAIMRYLFTSLFLFFFSCLLYAREPLTILAAGSLQAHPNYSGKIPKKSLPTKELNFIENKGQITDQYGNARKDIDFKIAACNGMNLFIGRTGIHYQWCKNSKVKSQNSKRSFSGREPSTLMQRMDVELVGANKYASIITDEKQDYYERYYTSACNADVGVVAPSYKKLTYKNIYPNIDWVLSLSPTLSINGEGEKLEYDFIIHPGGNVRDIKLKYKGTEKTELLKNGSLVLSTSMGSITEHKPFGYEQKSRTAISMSFALRGNTLGFNIGEYSGTLVLDPTLDWSTYYGGLGDDYGNAVACDAQGNVYMTGETSSISNIVTTGAYQTIIGGGSDAFIVQFTSAGQRQWATYFGGSGADIGEGIYYNGAGGILICGATSSTANIATAGAYQAIYGGGSSDAFLAKFNTAGARLWATYYGGTNSDDAHAVVCRAGNVYITGETGSTNNIATAAAYKDTLSGPSDVFIAKFNNSGSMQWATYYGGDSLDRAYAIAADTGGNVYLCGQTYSADGIATSGAYQDTLKGASDAFLSKFSSSGSMLWGTYYGGVGTETGFGEAIDTAGKVYMCGETNSTANIATGGSFQSVYGGGAGDGFLVQFDLSGSRQWATYYGGGAEDIAHGVVCNGNGKVYLSGSSASLTNIATSASYQPVYGGGSFDAFLVQFNTAGTRSWASYYGGTGEEDQYGSAIDAAGNVYITGSTGSSSHIASPNAYQGTYGGGAYDAYWARFKVDTLVMVSQPYIDTIFCAGDTFHLSYTTINTFQSANIFTAQLSDSSGNFANAVNIGSNAGTFAGSIFCTIPLATLSGPHYRIRIFSSHPADTSLDNGLNLLIRGIAAHSIGYNTPICQGDTLRLHDSVAATSTYHWTGPNSISSSLQDPYITNVSLSDSGFYYVIDSFQNGCKFKDSVFVSVGFIPFKPFGSSNSPVCLGDTLKLGAIDNTLGVLYQWSGPNAFSSSSQNPFIANATFPDSGKYTVKVHFNGCYSLTDTIHVAINSSVTPAVSITSIPATIIAGQTDTFNALFTNGGSLPTFQWYLNNTAIPAASGSSYITSLNSTDILCVLMHSNAACAVPDTVRACTHVNVGVVNVNAGAGIHIYPNPANNTIYINAAQKIRTVIADIQGKVLLSNADAATIDISSLQAGIYIIQVYDTDNRVLVTEKLIRMP